jgi:opacity protein-like surface antigen
MTRPNLNRISSIRLAQAAGLAALAALFTTAAPAQEIDLKSLKPIENKSKKGSAYVGVFVGQSTNQSAEMQLDYVGHTVNYDVIDRDGDLLAGFEVGYSWRTKYPIELGLEFEAFFGSTEINAIAGNASNAGVDIALGDVATARTDLNFAAFVVNATIALDLQKYRPRLGKYLPKFKPYVGGGIGGAQLWYRNVTTQSFGDLSGTPTAPASSPFSIDEFVFVSQVFAGLEYRWSDKLGFYGEYRKVMFDKTNELSKFDLDYVVGGLRLRY